MDREKSLFVEQNLGLVHLCANRFRGRGIEYDDLYSAGCMGLVKAVGAFDHDRGVKFSTYAVPVILGEIKRLFRDGGYVKVSRSVRELSLKTVRAREQFLKTNGREPCLSELSELLEVGEEAVVEALAVSLPPVSLTGSAEDNEVQIDIPTEAPDGEISDLLSLRQVMCTLDERDRRLLYLRYFKNKTQTETARSLDMTQVQVSRREKKLLTEMREVLLK